MKIIIYSNHNSQIKPLITISYSDVKTNIIFFIGKIYSLRQNDFLNHINIAHSHNLHLHTLTLSLF